MGIWGGRGAHDSVGGGVEGAGRAEGAGWEGTSPAQLCPQLPPPQPVMGFALSTWTSSLLPLNPVGLTPVQVIPGLPFCF